jgi:hypothetical protein
VLAWSVRWLVWRLLVGFAKLKFSEPSHYWSDRLYLKHFLMFLPMPTYVGWFMFKLPNWVPVVEVVFMFVAEVVAPCMLFFTGWPRAVGALLIIALMVGIQVTGNFGFFNLLTAVLCLGSLDLGSSLWDQRVPAVWTWTHWERVWRAWSESGVLGGVRAIASPLDTDWTEATFLALAVCLLIPASAALFPLNSWVSSGGFYWSTLQKLPVVEGVVTFFRALLPLRVVHAYGVFPPHTSPPYRWSAVFEGSDDGATWLTYRYPFFTTDERSPPVYVAPCRDSIISCFTRPLVHRASEGRLARASSSRSRPGLRTR